MSEENEKNLPEEYLSLEEDTDLNVYSAVSIAEGFDPVYTEEPAGDYKDGSVEPPAISSSKDCANLPATSVTPA